MGTFKDILNVVVGIAAPTKLVCRAVLIDELKKYGVALPQQCVDEVYAELEHHHNIATKKKELELALKGSGESINYVTNKSELAEQCAIAALGISSYLTHRSSAFVDSAGLKGILDKHLNHSTSTRRCDDTSNAGRIVIVLILNDAPLSYTDDNGDLYSFTEDEFSSCWDLADREMNQYGAYAMHPDNKNKLFLASFCGILIEYQFKSVGQYSNYLSGTDHILEEVAGLIKSDVQQKIRMHLAYGVGLIYPQIRAGDVAIVSCENGSVAVGIKRQGEEAPEAVLVSKTIKVVELFEQAFTDYQNRKT